MLEAPFFTVDCTDGERLGKLSVPLTEIADWLNFLATPHYRAKIISAEQSSGSVILYFSGNDGLYLYLERLLNVAAFPIAV